MFKPPSSCRTPTCPGLAVERGYCAVCLKLPEHEVVTLENKHDHHRQWKQLYDQQRWRHPLRGLRALVLRRDPVCMECKRRPSEIADHIIDHRGDQILFWSAKNLRGLCKLCHDAKTGMMHGIGERAAPKPGLVNGKVVDYAPNVDTPKSDTSGFDFLGALSKKPLTEPEDDK